MMTMTIQYLNRATKSPDSETGTARKVAEETWFKDVSVALSDGFPGS
jgi:hypothetical protein